MTDTMTRKEALTALLEKVEAGETDHGCFNQDWRGPLSYSGGCGVNAHKAYSGSIDAALALHEAVLPGWCVNLAFGYCHVIPPHDGGEDYACTGYSDNPARAWLIAIIRALIAMESDAYNNFRMKEI